MMRPSLRDYLRILLKWKLAAVLTFVSVVFFAVLGLQFKISEYESQVKLLLTLNEDSQRAVSSDTSLGETECEVILSYPVLRRVVQELNYHQRPKYYRLDYCSKISRPFYKWWIDFNEKIGKLLEGPGGTRKPDPEMDYKRGVLTLMESLKVKPITNTDMYWIAVRDYNPNEAARIANMISHVYILQTLKRRLAVFDATLEDPNPKLVELRSMIGRMERHLDNERLFNVENLGFSNIKIIETATPALKPKLAKALVMILAIPAGLFLAFLMVFIFERFDDTVKGPDDIKAHLNLPLLGSIPKTKRHKYRYNPKTNVLITPKKVRNAYENLAAEIYWGMQEQGLKVVHIASALPNAEVTPIIASIGAALAVTVKARVLIIDANLRNPNLHKLFGTTAQFHWDEFLGENDPEPQVHSITDNLSFLPSAVPKHSPVAIFRSEKLKKFVADCKTRYDVVLLNSSSMKKNNDGMALSVLADGVVYVVNEGQERRQAIAFTINSLKNKKIKFLGVILNNRAFVIPSLLIRWL